MTKTKSAQKPKSAAQPSAADVKFSTYIAKAHKQRHGSERTISGSALSTLDLMTDNLINQIIGKGRFCMRYAKTNTFSKDAAFAASKMVLTGDLQKRAVGAGEEALRAFTIASAAPAPAQAAAVPAA